MKCSMCNNEAEWISNKFQSPVCTDCARKIVDELQLTGEYSPDETAVADYYMPIQIDYRAGRANFNPSTGDVTYEVV